jgi:uncharacterized protein with GYD domain
MLCPGKRLLTVETGDPRIREEPIMPTYVLMSTLTDEGRKTVKERPDRIKEVNREIEGMGVRVIGQYAVLGAYDFISIVEAPNNETIARISVELGARGTVQIMTLPAIPIEDFTKQLLRDPPARSQPQRRPRNRK